MLILHHKYCTHFCSLSILLLKNEILLLNKFIYFRINNLIQNITSDRMLNFGLDWNSKINLPANQFICWSLTNIYNYFLKLNNIKMFHYHILGQISFKILDNLSDHTACACGYYFCISQQQSIIRLPENIHIKQY